MKRTIKFQIDSLNWLMSLKNPNRWFLFLSSFIMISIVAMSYFVASTDIPFATEGVFVKLYRINYAVIAWMTLLSNNLSTIRTYLVITGWIMIYMVVSTWAYLPPSNAASFTFYDNILHSNIGLISIFIGVIYSSDDEIESL
jgi:hypothetical protein